MLKIETNQIKAAMECVVTEKNDPRFYLRGVLLEITACGDVHLVSTDGERLFFGRIPAAKVQWADARPSGTREFILPYDALKQALKVKRFSMFIEHMGGASFKINGVDCQAIDGHFPAWRNVVNPAFSNIQADLPPMDWARVATVESALRTWSGNKTATVRLHGRGESLGVMATSDDANAFALVMPQKKSEVTPIITPTFPALLDDKV
jgi:hypothetical protein